MTALTALAQTKKHVCNNEFVINTNSVINKLSRTIMVISHSGNGSGKEGKAKQEERWQESEQRSINEWHNYHFRSTIIAHADTGARRSQNWVGAVLRLIMG